jgi:hypothetical protein
VIFLAAKVRSACLNFFLFCSKKKREKGGGGKKKKKKKRYACQSAKKQKLNGNIFMLNSSRPTI